MARIYDNRLAEEQIASLAMMEIHFLGTERKNNLVLQLEVKFGKRFFQHPNIESDPLFQEYSLNDTKIT